MSDLGSIGLVYILEMIAPLANEMTNTILSDLISAPLNVDDPLARRPLQRGPCNSDVCIEKTHLSRYSDMLACTQTAANDSVSEGRQPQIRSVICGLPNCFHHLKRLMTPLHHSYIFPKRRNLLADSMHTRYTTLARSQARRSEKRLWAK